MRASIQVLVEKEPTWCKPLQQLVPMLRASVKIPMAEWARRINLPRTGQRVTDEGVDVVAADTVPGLLLNKGFQAPGC